MANAEQVQPSKGPSLVIQIAMLMAVTVAAIGMGWLSGGYLKGAQGPDVVPPATATEAKHTEGGHAEGGKPEGGGAHGAAGVSTLVPLAPITTNLASPADMWIRLEVAVVYDVPQPPALAEQIQQDLMALARTLKLHQIEGASGYQHLKADLEERAMIRGGGHVKQVLIRTLLLE
ncbi:flagellar basal body-associated FliL family protein [Mesorhizobium sp.]|uniref:flagellar basal body-associated FliL family protein n=1 Tax=Mesorhizobium sp. TaxID=1871066 RepID=UPI003BA99567